MVGGGLRVEDFQGSPGRGTQIGDFGGAWGQNKPEWGPQGPGHTGGPRVPHLRESLGRVQTRNPHRVGGWPRDGDQSPQGCPEGWPGGRAPLDVTGAINGPRELEFREPNHSNDHLTSDLTTDLTSNFWSGRDGVDMSKLKIIRSLKNGR